MRKVIKILYTEKRNHQAGDYHRTHIVVDDGQVAVYYGNDVKLGDELEVFYDPKWDVVKARKTPKKP